MQTIILLCWLVLTANLIQPKKDHLGRHSQLRDCLDQVDLWACLEGIVS